MPTTAGSSRVLYGVTHDRMISASSQRMAGGVREIELTLTVFDAIEGLFRGFGGQ